MILNSPLMTNSEIPGWIQNSNILQSNQNLLDDDKKDDEIPDWISKFDSFDIADEEDTEDPSIPEWINLSDSENSVMNTEEDDKKEPIPDWIVDEISTEREEIPQFEDQSDTPETTSFETPQAQEKNYPESPENNGIGNIALNQR